MIDSTIYYNQDQTLTYHPAEVDVLADKVQLKQLPLQSGELCVLTVKNGKDADRYTGTATVNLVNNAALITVGSYQYYDLHYTASPTDYVSVADTTNFNIGNTYCIRFKVIPLYSGTPTANYYFFGISQDTTNASLVQLSHLTSSGKLRLEVYDTAGLVDSGLNTTTWNPTANQEYEIEINCNGSTVSMFIDGVLHSSAAYTISSGSKGRCYIGSTKAATGLSNCYIRDFQIFNTAQHSLGFASEIPRVVDIYKRYAIVETSAYVTTEEVYSFSDVVSGNVKYMLKIENDYSYISGGSLITSDKSYAQANTAAEITADLSVINAAIGSGKRIKFVPILYSGTNGNTQSYIETNAISYDFYGVAEPFSTCVVYGYTYDNLSPVASSTIRFYVKKPVAIEGKQVVIDTTVIPDSTGYYEFELPINDSSTPYLYELIITDLDGKIWKDKGSILVPQQASARLNDIKA